ncbi:MAG TPA: NAD(P)H-dependent oxidoreductase [Dongiaceae bacterium]|nr:NAD(P)H-dependent oxidoreductase [Dongiaceae bacterium]
MLRKIKLALIYGSTRSGRFCDTVVDWAGKQVCRTGKFELDLVDPAMLERPGAAEGESVDHGWLRKRIGDAEAFLVVTPEYNHGYTAGLKALIDAVGEEWHAKPVAFVSYGGISGGLRAVEQLRLVFAELHAVTIRDSVSFASAWEQWDAGVLKHPERPERQMAAMLKRLAWWAETLRMGRTTNPYSSAA